MFVKGILFHGEDYLRLRLFRSRLNKTGSKNGISSVLPESDTLSNVRACYSRLTQMLTATAESQMAARLQALSRRPLAAAEQYYRLRLDKVAAAAAADRRQIRRCLRQRLPMGLCVLDFCCLETRQKDVFTFDIFKMLMSCSIEYLFIFIKNFNFLGRKWSVLYSSGCRRLCRELGMFKFQNSRRRFTCVLKCSLTFIIDGSVTTSVLPCQ